MTTFLRTNPANYVATAVDYTLDATDRFVAVTSALGRTITLPPADEVAPFEPIIICDEVNAAGVNAITVAPDGTDTINGVNAAVEIHVNGGSLVLYVNSSGQWTATAHSGALDPSGYNTIIATADEDVTNAQNTDHTEFQFAVVASRRYLIDVEMMISGNNTTGDFEFRFAVAAGTMDGGGHYQSLGASLAIANTAITASAAANTADLPVGTSNNLAVPIAVRAQFAFVPSNTTTLKLQFGNNAAAAGRTSRIIKGSVLRWKEAA